MNSPFESGSPFVSGFARVENKDTLSIHLLPRSDLTPPSWNYWQDRLTRKTQYLAQEREGAELLRARSKDDPDGRKVASLALRRISYWEKKYKALFDLQENFDSLTRANHPTTLDRLCLPFRNELSAVEVTQDQLSNLRKARLGHLANILAQTNLDRLTKLKDRITDRNSPFSKDLDMNSITKYWLDEKIGYLQKRQDSEVVTPELGFFAQLAFNLTSTARRARALTVLPTTLGLF